MYPPLVGQQAEVWPSALHAVAQIRHPSNGTKRQTDKLGGVGIQPRAMMCTVPPLRHDILCTVRQVIDTVTVVENECTGHRTPAGKRASEKMSPSCPSGYSSRLPCLLGHWPIAATGLGSPMRRGGRAMLGTCHLPAQTKSSRGY